MTAMISSTFGGSAGLASNEQAAAYAFVLIPAGSRDGSTSSPRLN
jgi:hypothetical protein